MALSEEFRKELATANVSDLMPSLEWWIKGRYPAESLVGAIREITRGLSGLLDEDEIEEPVTLIQIGDFLEECGEPPEMFVEDMLPAKSLILWSGKAKYGKSLATYQIMEDIALGRPVFGKFSVNEAGAVIYIGIEDGAVEINRRFRGRGMTVENKDLPIYITTQMRDYSLRESIVELDAVISELPSPPVLVIIDTVTESFDSVREWNDRNQTKRAIRPLRQWAQKNCTVIAISHNVKGNAEDRDSGDEISGSGAIVSSVDGYLSCYKRQRLPNGNLRLFVRGGGRGGICAREFVIEMDTETYEWRWLDTDEVESAKREEYIESRKPYYERVLKAMEARGTVNDIAAKMGTDNDKIRRAIKEMLGLDLVIDTGEKIKGSLGGRGLTVYSPSPSSSSRNPYIETPTTTNNGAARMEEPAFDD